ncbi:hypothetical protein ONS95_012308 [Cadophora gregata]|uniref:uncharacterized protein n=1 Tax=Cadophora gregata TaxID=51156 RepID=UPI0026DB2373|nr:uncharacterized protein ONS95_012308 [Cadophora gregata]KAK0117997.1 hypothetical protein ONS95_012308 [Cadophora gregata]KAK0123064.1 hypothetical protein ONS96_010072 [Cadophora gregata f. sp. sojae]
MSPSAYKYIYSSQLQFMFTLTGLVSNSKPDLDGLTKEQCQLWSAVIENRDRVLRTSLYQDEDPAIQQYMLEIRTWNQFWPKRPFPGDEPKKIESESNSPVLSLDVKTSPKKTPNYPSTQTSSSPPAQYYPMSMDTKLETGSDQLLHLLSPTDHYLVVQSASDESLRAECRAAILHHKGADHVPYHGWDDGTGLPRYSIVCTATNGFLVFCGPQQEYFRVLKDHFLSTARIMYQRARTGLMIVWIETPTYNRVMELRTNKKLWNEFKGCWAFLKCWADSAGEGRADNIADFLRGWRPDLASFDALELELPPVEVHRQVHHGRNRNVQG